jgi:prepilin-type processing-associated H-X9-DG protein
MASAMYQDANSGYFPGAHLSIRQAWYVTFVPDLAPYLGVDPSKATDRLTMKRFFWCPSDAIRERYKTEFYSYGQNNHVHYGASHAKSAMKRNSKVRVPGRIIYLTDMVRDKEGQMGWPGSIDVTVYPFYYMANINSRVDHRHNGKANVLWVSGHVNSRSFGELYETRGKFIVQD